MTWSGRYAFTFSVSLIELIGIQLVPYLPTLALVLWLAVTSWAVYQNRLWESRSTAISISILIASLLIFTILENIPNVHQSLYWQTGMLTYIAPLILATIIIGLLIYHLRRATVHHAPATMVSLAALTFIAGGFSEMYATMQTTAFIVALITFLTIPAATCKRPIKALLIAGLVGSILSMGVIFIAPGNEIRQALTPESPSFFNVIKWSLVYAFKFIGKTILLSPIPTLLALFIAALLTFSHPLRGDESGEILPRLDLKHLYSFLLLSPPIGFLLIASSMAPSVYGVSAFPEDRTLTIPQFVLTSTIIFWGLVGGLALKKRSGWITKHKSRISVIVCCLVAVLLVLGPLLSSRDNFVQVPTLRAYAERWDTRDREIRVAREAGAMHLAITGLGFTGGLADIKDDPDYWVNRCFASYYGLESVVSE
ncbi:MAG: hypothetical protein JSV37_05050 [Anaerolineaceae bacterium]|nr:MAG: hypothetical protein JSV37_05050 [Anaerolineaceae bacterium]